MFERSKHKSNKLSNKQKTEISVVIITRNRQPQLLNFLDALKKSTFSAYELIIVDQSDKNTSGSDLQECLADFTHVQYLQTHETGKSRGLNKAITMSKSPLIAFTDDDCIPDKHWLKQVSNSFAQNPQIVGVFGSTLPYQPQKHPNLHCPSTFKNSNPAAHIISEPRVHWKSIGLGNNMAFRKQHLVELGGFREWLGPGSIGSNAEDGEIALRTLHANKLLFYNPDMVVFHDRWLTSTELQTQYLSYLCGELACYGYFALQGSKLGKSVFIEQWRACFTYEIRAVLDSLIHLRSGSIPAAWLWIKRLVARLRGTVVAGYYFVEITYFKK